MKADIVLWGLRIDKIFSKQYRIIFEYLPLWEDSVQKRNIPVFYTELWGKNGTQFFIDYASHDRLFQSISEFAGKQFGLFFKDKVMISDVWKCLINYLLFIRLVASNMKDKRIIRLKEAHFCTLGIPEKSFWEQFIEIFK